MDNGTNADRTSVEVVGGNVTDPVLVVDKPPTSKLTKVANTGQALILSFGMVSALHLFIWLAYLHPDAANILMPLLFLPLLDRMVRLIRGK